MKIHAILIALIVACSPSPLRPLPDAGSIAPRSCNAFCSSSDECRNDISGCRVCFNARCVNSLPAQPTNDAGVDAPARTK